jgi:uncharacterized protein involved in exopolysaccharide biosynthesis
MGMTEELNIGQYLKILCRRKWVIFSFVFLAVIVGLVTSLFTKPLYSASAVIKVGDSFSTESRELLETDLKSDKVIDEARKKFNLDTPAEELKKNISVNFSKSTVVLTVYSEEPKVAAEVVNFLAKQAVEYANSIGRVNSLIREAKYVREGIKMLEEKIRDMEKDLKRLESEEANTALERVTKISNISSLRSEMANLYNLKVSRERELSQIEFSIQKETAELESSASTPISPIKPNLKFNIVFSLLAGLIIGAAVAILMGET